MRYFLRQKLQSHKNMTKKHDINLREIEGFKNINEESIEKINENSELLQYDFSQVLSTSQIISNKILFLLEGEARLLIQNEEKLITLDKLKRPTTVGLVSLLRAEPCEEVSAVSDVTAIAIPDNLILEIYQNDQVFRDWCNQLIYSVEIYSVLSRCNIGYLKSGINQDIIFSLIKSNSNIKTYTNNELSITKTNHFSFISSANLIDLKPGDLLNNNQKIESRPPMNVRVLEVSKDVEHLIEKLSTNKSNSNQNIETTGSLNTKNNISKAPITPDVSAIELGNYSNNQPFTIIKANGKLEETLACLQMLSSFMKLPFRKDSIEKILRDTVSRNQTISIELCGAIASMLGLHTAIANKVTFIAATRLQIPCLITWKDSFAIVTKSDSSGLEIASPSSGSIRIEQDNLENEFPEGFDILMVDRTNATPNKKFGVNWFWPSLKKYRASLIQVLIASFVVQLFTLANPLLIQVIIDKVISQRSLDTLQVLGIALVVVTIIGGLISSLRTFLFTETTNRIDVRLSAEVIDHLLRLPLNYFDKRAVGELGSRVAELEQIRNFLTGQALTTILDAAFSIIYIVVMVMYSWLLTIAALFVVPIQIALTLLGAPIIRRQIREIAIENAKTQSHLVEVLTGVQTVKAQNVETVSRWKWQNFYKKYISRSFEKTITGTTLSQISNVMQQLSQLIVLWIGATLVLKGQLTLGQLIAFRIISGYVTQPLLRLSTIWQNVQQLRVSFERLSDIIDTPEESSEADKANLTLPTIEGKVSFKNVSFSFPNSDKKILSNVSLNIKPGTFVGIVGQSGSGKSTLMKLLPRLYQTNSGKISIDNYDIDKVELYSLRRQIGIVPQDPLLFAGSVSENIALADPNAKSEDIANAARIASAHDFIMDLPLGYSSDVGERGSGLSGGQKQRIAIARTIMSNPGMIILDEATSALDYETERKVCENLRKSSKGKTVFFITHRLSTIKNADLIVMLHDGVIAETGTHTELINKKGRYFALYRQQEST